MKSCVQEMIINKKKITLLVNFIRIHTSKNKKFSIQNELILISLS